MVDVHQLNQVLSVYCRGQTRHTFWPKQFIFYIYDKLEPDLLLERSPLASQVWIYARNSTTTKLRLYKTYIWHVLVIKKMTIKVSIQKPWPDLRDLWPFKSFLQTAYRS